MRGGGDTGNATSSTVNDLSRPTGATINTNDGCDVGSEGISNSLSDVGICGTTSSRTDTVLLGGEADSADSAEEGIGHSTTKSSFLGRLLSGHKRKGFTQVTC